MKDGTYIDGPLFVEIPEADELGWQPPEDGISPEAWERRIKRAQLVERSILWVIGDLLNWGEDHLDDDYYQGFEFHYEPKTIERARKICRAFPRARRRPFVSIWKHEVLAPRHIPREVQDAILDEANDIEYGGLTMKEIHARKEDYEQGGKAEKIPAPPECPTCGSSNEHWTRIPPEVRTPLPGERHLRAV